MVKLLTKKTFLLIFLMVNFCLYSSVLAESNQVVQGNIIKKITTTSQRGNPVLLVKGTLDPAQLSNVVVKKRKGSKTFTISIPNALIDPEKITEPVLKFGSKTPIARIKILENIKEMRGEVVFTIDLVVEGRKEFSPEIQKPITSSLLKINLIDLERIRRQKAESEKAEEDRIREEQQKQKVEEKERQMAFDKAKAEKSKKDSISKMAQKSVDDLIQHYEKPSLMQITIVNASGWKKRADKLSVFLDKLQRKYIEESLGIKLDMVNVSDAKSAIHQQSTIFFKNNFLKSALFLAKLIPGEQKLAPMSMSARKERLGVDIMIFLGKDYK